MSQSLLSSCVVFVLRVAMVDVCCMCGDVGFHDKLFRCKKCRYRFQHSYCSNLYGELTEIQVCDWCQSEAKTTTRPHNKPVVALASNVRSCQYSSTSSSSSSSSSGHKLMKENGGNSEKAGKSSPIPSPRHATRRYKLLKDVMC
ncbi:uncharacterized protein [Cicer arietinum]|uniref:Uncharacterized protein LOC101500803 n=1 Tax=Cicer arietinum TaxID=3827 RepID=A0A1S2YUD8_CICAR|nr:uncharacterized protein LOC101500803 [Cicer arietinum]